MTTCSACVHPRHQDSSVITSESLHNNESRFYRSSSVWKHVNAVFVLLQLHLTVTLFPLPLPLQTRLLHTREGGPPQRAPAHGLGAGRGAERAAGPGRVRRLQPEHGPVLVLRAVRRGALHRHHQQVPAAPDSDLQ